MNAVGKFRLLLDMSRKRSKFISDDCWSDLGRYRRAEAPRYHVPPVDGGWYCPRPILSLQSLAWDLGQPQNARNWNANFRRSPAMKRVNESHALPNPKSPKVHDQMENPYHHHLPGPGVSSTTFNGFTNAANDETYHYFPFNTGSSNASTSNLLNDFPRPHYDRTFARHLHNSPNHFSNETRVTGAVDGSKQNYHGSNPSTRIPTPQPMPGETTKRFQLHREWHTIDSINVDKAVVQPIRIISYNILSQKLLELNRYLYHKCDPQILKWNYRWEKLQKEMQELNADILCLQEVEERHFECDILNFLRQNDYECHYKRRTGDNTNKPDGVLIAFKKDKFELMEIRKVEYRRGSVPPVNQDNVAVVTILKPIGGAVASDNNRLCVVNTHLLYNPKRGDIKLAQLSTLFAEVHDMLSSHNASEVGLPILMCGDFNSIPQSRLFNFITTQELKYSGVASKHVSGQKVGAKGKDVLLPKYLLPESLRISCHGCVKVDKGHHLTGLPFRVNHSIGELLSSYCHDKLQASTTQDKGVTVDYIFHTPYNEHTLSLHPNRRLSLVSPRSLAAAGGIPNAAHPSDHLPIVVDFDLVLPRVVQEE